MILKTYIATLKRKVNKNSNVSMGPKNLATPAHFISGPRPTPRRKICPRTNKEGPNCQGTLPRTGESGMPPKAVSQSVLRERTSAMRQS